MEKELVHMEHDGAIDDLLSQILLLTMKNKEILGINVTPADCFIEPALETVYKILHLFNRTDIPVGRHDFHGVNAFPNEWRARPGIINVLPAFINLPSTPDPYTYPKATELLIDNLTGADGKVSLIMTGPCSNLVNALEKQPRIKEKINRIVWMGGAFRTQGNVQNFQHNGSAEWNVYWDPLSARKLLESGLPLVMIPLDVTNKVPVDRKFLSKLSGQSAYRISDIAGQLWALTTDVIPAYHYVYFMWDVLATSYLDIPGEFKTEEIRARVSVRPPNEGQTLIDEKGQVLSIAVDINKDIFYDYLLEQFRR